MTTKPLYLGETAVSAENPEETTEQNKASKTPVFDDVKDLELFYKLLKKEERRQERRKKRKADWDDPKQKCEYVKNLKQQKRQELLDRLVPSRKCCCCMKTKTKSRSWSVIDIEKLKGLRTKEATRVRRVAVSNRAAICRGCAQKHFKAQLWAGKRKRPTEENETSPA